jgi:hypothetical protein
VLNLFTPRLTSLSEYDSQGRRTPDLDREHLYLIDLQNVDASTRKAEILENTSKIQGYPD